MKTKRLEDIQINFEAWCKENNINIFYTDDNSSLPSIIYSDRNDESLLDFKKIILKKSPPFILIIGKDVLLEKNFYESHSDWVEENDENYESHLSLLEVNANNLVSLEIGFVHEGVFFYIYESAEWIDDFEEISDIMLKYDPTDVDDESDSKLPKIPKEEANQLAREIASSEEYGKATNMIHRSDISERKAQIYFDDKEYNYDWKSGQTIATKAENIFNEEIKPKRDEDLKSQIRDLKSQGQKKVQITSKLGITIGTLNKFWETV